MLNSESEVKVFKSSQFHIEEISSYDLSLAYSFGKLFIMVSKSSELLYFNHFQWNNTNKPEVSSIKSIIESIDFLVNPSFRMIKFEILSAEFTLIPSEFFEVTKASKYLEFVADKTFNEIGVQALTNVLSMAVFSVNSEIKNYVYEKFKVSTIKSTSVALVDNLLKGSNVLQDILHINVNSNLIECVFIQNKALIFHNFFEYQTAEELMFYVLSVAQQFNLNREKVTLQISGSISEDSKIFQLFQKYFYSVKFVETKDNVGVSKDLQIACYPLLSDLK